MTQCVISPPRRDSAADWLRPLTVATVTTLRKDPDGCDRLRSLTITTQRKDQVGCDRLQDQVGCDRLRSLTITALRKDLLPDFRRERRSMQQCNSRSYPRNSDKISLSRAPTTIYIILPIRWFLFWICRERRSMQQCNSRSYPRNSGKNSLSRAQNTSLWHFTVSQVSDMDFGGTGRESQGVVVRGRKAAGKRSDSLCLRQRQKTRLLPCFFDVFDVFPFVYARPALIKLLPFCGFSVHIVPVVAAIIGRGFGIIITHCIC